MEVGQRAIQPDVELFIRCHDLTIASPGGMERPVYLDECVLIREVRPVSPADFTRDRKIPLNDFSSRQERVEADLIRMDCRRSRHTEECDPPIHTIQPLISERNSILGRDRLQTSASPASYLPTDFEKVRKIRIHREGEADWNGNKAVVVHSKALEAAALPQEPSAGQVQCAARNLHLSFMSDIGIREIDVEHDVVFLERRTEQ